jgi:hypothetical protein
MPITEPDRSGHLIVAKQAARQLGRPLSWFAMFALGLNDAVLKNLVANVWTGKLSDFSGL